MAHFSILLRIDTTLQFSEASTNKNSQVPGELKQEFSAALSENLLSQLIDRLASQFVLTTGVPI
ncbi:MAG: hypothetical protein DMG73_13305 [Acidobacteria bacterium]|nr:MAG: hypothetical protein DMG73_13305 [Acidobacteriota bacterium]